MKYFKSNYLDSEIAVFFIKEKENKNNSFVYLFTAVQNYAYRSQIPFISEKTEWIECTEEEFLAGARQTLEHLQQTALE